MLAGLGAVVNSGTATAASLQEVTNFGYNPSNLRMFSYVPSRVQSRPPILVAVHYCGGNSSNSPPADFSINGRPCAMA